MPTVTPADAPETVTTATPDPSGFGQMSERTKKFALITQSKLVNATAMPTPGTNSAVVLLNSTDETLMSDLEQMERCIWHAH